MQKAEFKLDLALFMVLYMVLAVAVSLPIIFVPKYLAKRERPSRIKSVYRICVMRDKEGH